MFGAHSHAGMNAYRKVGIESIVDSASPHQLVLMLFDGARAALLQARTQMLAKNITAKGEAIAKASSIIDGGLRASLDLGVGGELARNLHDLYGYMIQRLLQANLRNDSAALDEVADLLEQLGGAWASLAPAPASASAAPPERGERRVVSYGSA
jgi:flagellar protein FliS